jgi:hypothetical protein
MRIKGMHEFGMTVELTRNDVEKLERICEVASGELETCEYADDYRTIFQLAFHAIRATDHRLIDGETLKPLRPNHQVAD